MMPRPILFRAKALDSGEWIYGSLVTTDHGAAIVNTTGRRIDTVEVDPETVQERLFNWHNGRDLWEGDVYADPATPEYMHEIYYDVNYDQFRIRSIGNKDDIVLSEPVRIRLINFPRLKYVGNIVDLFTY